MKGGEVKGISQYNYHHNERGWIWANETWVTRAIHEAAKAIRVLCAPHEDIVADVWVQDPTNTVLIEINPYGKSDPCLFRSYKNIENHDGSIVYRNQSKEEKDVYRKKEE
jgi:hypothetical protein